MTDWHSDNGIDKLVVPMLPEFGYACEVGACDGTSGSNTLTLEKAGWIVMCIDPVPGNSVPGRLSRKLWRELAVGAEDSESHEFTIVGNPPYASYSSLGKADRYGNPEGQSIQVRVRTLDRILEEAGFPRLDFLSIDTEGWEQEVLAGFSHNVWRPRIITVEEFDGRNYETPPEYERIDKLGYDLVWKRRPGC